MRIKRQGRFLYVNRQLTSRMGSRLAEELLKYIFILLLIAVLEADLRVSNDANCVKDVRRSAKRVFLA